MPETIGRRNAKDRLGVGRTRPIARPVSFLPDLGAPQVAGQTGRESTLRPRGRPKKKQEK